MLYISHHHHTVVLRCLVQALLASSYQGYGVSSLDKDAEEITSLITTLRLDHASKVCSLQFAMKCWELAAMHTSWLTEPGAVLQGVVLMGHSTGCQDTVRCVEGMGPQEHPFLLGIILQAPVRHSSVHILI